MATLDELKQALKETLESRGVLSQLKAKMRAEIFAALEDTEIQKPRLSDENLMINELIREYLTFNGYEHTLSTFIPESGQPDSPAFDRHFLAKELQISEDYKSRSVPLLYGIVKGLRAVEIREAEEERETKAVPGRKQVEPRVFSQDPEPLMFTK